MGKLLKLAVGAAAIAGLVVLYKKMTGCDCNQTHTEFEEEFTQFESEFPAQKPSDTEPLKQEDVQ